MQMRLFLSIVAGLLLATAFADAARADDTDSFEWGTPAPGVAAAPHVNR
jgi:hypothetical protein